MFALPGSAPSARASADDAPVDGWTDPQADWAELQFSPVKIGAVARVAADAGVPPAVLLQGTGVDPQRLQDADCKTSTAQLYRVLARAATLLGSRPTGTLASSAFVAVSTTDTVPAAALAPGLRSGSRANTAPSACACSRARRSSSRR